MQRDREAEQAPGVPVLLQDILGVQVESGQSLTSREKGDEPEHAGDPALHENVKLP